MSINTQISSSTTSSTQTSTLPSSSMSKSESTPLLQIIDLHASINTEVGENDEYKEKEILKGINLTIEKGESHALMGPNGSGKSSLSNVILAHPNYKITKGDILFEGKSILDKSTEQRALMGIFLSFQHPTTIPGVTLFNFLRNSLRVNEKFKL